MIMKNDFMVNDQLLMEKAVNYNRFLFSLIEPWLMGNVLEIGSGIGNITQQVLEHSQKIKSLTCVEIDGGACKRLSERISSLNPRIPIEMINADFMAAGLNKQYDCIFSSNVLEHIENDLGALTKMKEGLSPSGKILCYVPAMKILYGTMDRELKHYRRYTKKELVEKARSVGLKIVKLRYYNFFGFFGWLINNRFLKAHSQNENQVKAFDRYVIPWQSRVESLVNIPFGQSLFFIAEK